MHENLPPKIEPKFSVFNLIKLKSNWNKIFAPVRFLKQFFRFVNFLHTPTSHVLSSHRLVLCFFFFFFLLPCLLLTLISYLIFFFIYFSSPRLCGSSYQINQFYKLHAVSLSSLYYKIHSFHENEEKVQEIQQYLFLVRNTIFGWNGKISPRMLV